MASLALKALILWFVLGSFVGFIAHENGDDATRWAFIVWVTGIFGAIYYFTWGASPSVEIE